MPERKRHQAEWAQMLLVAVVTAIAGEFKITPFSGELFRIGLGSSAFLLCLLLMRQLPYMLTGVVTGITVLCFRMIMDAVYVDDSFSFAASLHSHFSAGLYYMIFAVGMGRIQTRLSEFHPLILGSFITVIEFISNELELLTRSILFGYPYLYSAQWLLLGATAVLRSYFVVGLYSSITINQMRVVHNEQQKRMEQMLNIGSGLYGEVFYLKKSMDTLERITAKSHNLYDRLGETGSQEERRAMLEITQQIHEVKKDSQRILAGLLKLFDRKTTTEMSLSEIADFVFRSNSGYSQMLRKDIRMEREIRTDYVTDHYILLLTVLNNLVSNAIEAIDQEGRVRIRIYEENAETVIAVSDTGEGIAEQNREIIFEPGFTTKFNQSGYAATGIGLSHVRDIVQAFGGKLRLQPSEQAEDTTFILIFSTDSLKKGV
ncbi:ATP-binding protein [Paenibacillus nasutitermitis]|uniref:histidine kinase n=1 Tax=Paenibacillus nasutitermitis TaxID=1652958 RepID=A0A917E0W6_9BACL|nr:ATP-binding protein [Paenibacillus nasutitermitis]GGD90721.1 sensor histidine kinase [Paenibacillus nasutitermitis]